MPVSAVRLNRSRNATGGLVLRFGVPLLDEYLEFLGGRCRILVHAEAVWRPPHPVGPEPANHPIAQAGPGSKRRAAWL